MAISALRTDNATLLWQYKTNGILLSSPVTTNGIVYVGANDGSVYAIHADDGSLLWPCLLQLLEGLQVVNHQDELLK